MSQISTKRLTIPTLMYHSVKPSSDDYLTVSLANFYRQIKQLAASHQIIPVGHVLENFQEQRALPENPLILSFDDGLVDNIEYAVPVLQEFGVSAVFFIIARYIGQSNSWNHRAYCFENHLSAADLKNLVRSGFELGNHSLTHQRLTKLSDAELAAEFVDAHQVILETSGSAPIAFSYPYGHADGRCIELCKAFYPFGFVSDKQGEVNWLQNPANIRRIYVAPDDTPEDLESKITRNYSR